MFRRLLLLLALTAICINAQTIDTPSFVLSGIGFDVKVTNLPDSVSQAAVNVTNNAYKKVYTFTAANGAADSSITIPSFGSYEITAGGISKSIRVIPAWFSILPPLLAIFMALIIRQVLVSLAAGIYLGAVFIYDYNPLTAVLRLADTIILNTLIDKDHMYIILFTLLFGGVIGVISRNGGTAGLSNQVTKLARTTRSGMISSWLMGLVIFFDDYSNSLIIGNMMRPITDKLRVSREKLAYIVDSTAAPVASIFVISSWIGFEIALIDGGLDAIGSNLNAYELLIQTIPYRFYPIAALFFVFLTSYMQRDYGLMYKAEKRARTTGQLYDKDALVSESKEEQHLLSKPEKARWYNGAVPIAIILFGTVAGLIYTGIESLESAGVTGYGVREVISNSDSFSSLLWASFFACLAAIIMSISQKLMSLSEAVNSWHKGVQSMLIACVILVFAWSISAVTEDLYTAEYLISLISDTINPMFLPVLVFILCALISFSTGTSWGTMAIIMPIAIPLVHHMSTVNNVAPPDATILMYGAISSVLAGSVFGDHCSPIADTTILSSMASRCNHIDHVNTQLPYALTVGVVSMLFGDILTAYGLSPYISLGIIFVILYLILRFVGKKTEGYSPAEAGETAPES